MAGSRADRTDADSNALFGSLQVITANRLDLSPILMVSTNSAGGVMGKMIDAQSIIVACAAVGEEGKEGDLFRAVLPHSIALAIVVSLIVFLFAYYGQVWIPSGSVWSYEHFEQSMFRAREPPKHLSLAFFS